MRQWMETSWSELEHKAIKKPIKDDPFTDL